MVGQVRCASCSEKDAAEYAILKVTPGYKKRKAESDRRVREKRRNAGLCVRCGQRPAQEGRVVCLECKIANARIQKKRNNEIPRHERPNYGLCYVCGELVKPGFRLCEKHYAQLTTMRASFSASPTEKMLEDRARKRRATMLAFQEGRCEY